MDKHKIYIKEILDLTMEIIYLLTGEDYTVVKKASGVGHCPMYMTSSYLLRTDRNTNKKILEVTNRIINLLTSQGCTNIEDCKKQESMEIQQIFTSPDGSRNPPESCSQYCTQEDHEIPHHCQVQDLADVKNEMNAKGGQHSTVNDKKIVEIKEEGGFSDDSHKMNSEPSVEHLNCDQEENIISGPPQGGNSISHQVHPSEDSLSDLHNVEEPFSDPTGNVGSATPSGLDNMNGSLTLSKLEENSPNHSCTTSPGDQTTVHSKARLPEASKPKESTSDKSKMVSTELHSLERLIDSSIHEKQASYKSEKDEPGSGSKSSNTKSSNLAEEPKMDTNSCSLKCSDCGKSFEEQEELDQHRQTHTGEKPYSCSDCGKRFPVKSKLIQHLRVHTGERPFPCTVCGRCFTTKTNLATHQSIHTEEKPFSCPKCEKCFSRKSSLLAHLRIHNGDKEFTCGECGKSFTLKCYLRIHEKIHTGEKPFSCSDCGKCFLQRSAFVKHQRLHRGDKPFSCSECGRCFLEKGQLSIHQRIHTGERPYACSECYKSFIKKSDLQRHQRTHTGEKPFSCSECGKSFSQKAHLVAHKRVHTGEKSPSCSECGRCPQKSLFGQHHEGHTH